MNKREEFKFWNRLTTIFELIIVIIIWSKYGWQFGILSFLGILILAGIYIRLGYLRRDTQRCEIVEVKYICEKCEDNK